MGDLWLPQGFQLNDHVKVGASLYSGKGWQIVKTSISKVALIARLELAQKWIEYGLVEESLFEASGFGNHKFLFLLVKEASTVGPLNYKNYPDTEASALALAEAFKVSRAHLPAEVSLHEAIYLEELSRLLPTFAETEQLTDDIVFGSWLSAGVPVSTANSQRIRELVAWLPSEELEKVLSTAGLCANKKTRTRFNEKSALGKKEVQEEGNTNPDAFSLPGRPQLEEFFNEHVVDILRNPERYERLGVHFPSAIILYGPPGCGKTYAVDQLVKYLQLPCYEINSNSVGSPYIHETSKKVSQVFDEAIAHAPSVLIIDEMESFLSDRRQELNGVHHIEEVAEFLRRIPEAIPKKVLIIAMTNMLDMIDPAILRRGRFDHKVEVGMPSRDEVIALMQALLQKIPTATDLEIDHLANYLAGKSLADTSFAIREAARMAAKAGKSELDQESLDLVLRKMKPVSEKEKKGNPIGFV